MRRTLHMLAVAIPLVALASSASAQLTMFTSRSAFESAAGALTTEAFDMPLSVVPNDGATFAFGGGMMTFDANHGDQTFGGGDVFADLHPTGTTVSQFLRFDFGSPVFAFGADFSEFDLPGITLRGFVDGSAFDVSEGFFGIVSTTAFSSLELRDPSDFTLFAVDNVSLTAAPEPATLPLLFGGLAIGAFVLRRRRRAA